MSERHAPVAAVAADAPVGSVLDVRDEAAFLAGHHPQAASIPLEELPLRVHELPVRHAPMAVYDVDSARARAALDELAARGFESIAPCPPPETAKSCPYESWIAGPARVRLWQPHEWLRDSLPVIEAALCGPGDVLDIACGSGRDAVWMALRGWRAAAWDSLPDALSRADDLARRHGVDLATRAVDLERGLDPATAGAMRFDLVTVFNYLHRPLFPLIRALVRPGGWVTYETFVEPQRERFGKPRRAEFELRRGELRAAFEGWNVERYVEGEGGQGRITARIAARKP